MKKGKMCKICSFRLMVVFLFSFAIALFLFGVTSLRVSAQTKSPDLNNDGKVDNLDFLLVLKRFGILINNQDEDLDGNGKINLIDALIIISRWGLTTPSLSPTPSVGPEDYFHKPIMIEVDNYTSNKNQLSGLGPFYVYGWAVDETLGNYNLKINALTSVASDPLVVKRFIMFSSDTGMMEMIPDNATAQQLKASGIDGLFLNSEPGLTQKDNFNDILLNDRSTNLVVKFINHANQYGFDAQWGPMRRNLDSHPSDGVSDQALSYMFEAGLDGIGLQEQQQIDESCVSNIIWGPHSIGGQPADSINFTVTRLRNIAQNYQQSFEVVIQILPGYPAEGVSSGNDSCWAGDNYGQNYCSETYNIMPYGHCRLFAEVTQNADLVDSIAIWASATTERTQMLDLISALRSPTN